MEQHIFIALSVWILLAGALLVWFREFNECIVGGLGLFILIITNSAILVDIWNDTEYHQFLPTTLWMLFGIALVLTQSVLSHIKWWIRQDKANRDKLFY